MRRAALLTIALLAGCEGRLPTGPVPNTARLANATTPPCTSAAITEPPVIVMLRGTTRTARIRLCYVEAAFTPVKIDVSPPEIATGQTTIAVGRNVADLTITANTAGVARVYYIASVIGRGPVIGAAGDVHVIEPTRRRGVAR